MKAKDIRVGGNYLVKADGVRVPVRVDKIDGEGFVAVNLKSRRKVLFKSAAKFLREITGPQTKAFLKHGEEADFLKEGEQRPDPTSPQILESAKSAGGETAEKIGHAHTLREKCSDPTPGARMPLSSTSRPKSAIRRTQNGSGASARTAPLRGTSPSSPTSSRSTRETVTTPASSPVVAAAKPVGPRPSGLSKPSGLAAQLRKHPSPKPGQEPPHLVVLARAGTGKTTTLVEGLKAMRGLPVSITPSPQQEAVWESLKLSRGARSVCFVAFNKAIATELQNRVPKGCDAMTMHSMGYRAIRDCFPLLPGGNGVNDFRTENIIEEVLEENIREIRKTRIELLRACKALVSLCKMNLTDEDSEEELDALISHYDIDMDKVSRPELYGLVQRVLERAKDVRRDGYVDYNDLIWVPAVLDLPLFRYDVLLVDEAQDLNRCQQELAKRAGRRIVLCGDDKQAIYGFAGADSDSIPNMTRDLKNTEPGCVTLPLTVTRRCGKKIVREAQKYVPEFEAYDTNPPGVVSDARYPIQGGGIDQRGERKNSVELPWEQTYCSQVKDGDFILCRVNAPLVSQCFRFLKRGIKADIQGREIAKGLVSAVEKLSGGSQDVSAFLVRLDDWLEAEMRKEQARKNPSEARMIALADKHECLLCFAEGQSFVHEILTRINAVFTDEKWTRGVRLSSIHRAKGLEAKRVFFLMPKGGECPHPMARTKWQQEQEYNLLYVGITRAIEELVFVY